MSKLLGAVRRVNSHEAMPIATYRTAVDIRDSVDVLFEWVLGTAAAISPAATIAIYTSALPHNARELDDLDPTTNPFWILQSAAVFASLPGTSIGSDSVTLANSPFATALVEIDVLSALTDFSFHVRGSRRG